MHKVLDDFLAEREQAFAEKRAAVMTVEGRTIIVDLPSGATTDGRFQADADDAVVGDALPNVHLATFLPTVNDSDFSPTNGRVVKRESTLLPIPDDLSSEQRVHEFLGRLLPVVGVRDPAAALAPWVCDRLPSVNSRKAYAADLAKFVMQLKAAGIDLR